MMSRQATCRTNPFSCRGLSKRITGSSALKAEVVGMVSVLARVVSLFSWVLLALPEIVSAAAAPPYTDYCAMLARDIAGRQHGFLAGDHLYYIGGQCDTKWRTTEHETIGFTHPMFRDGRARGHGIVTGRGGTGHDMWGWEFWRKTRAAYGTVLLEGNRFRHPIPREMIWRPDRQICRYEVGGVTIREVKFISLDDVLCSIIRCSAPVTLEFQGHSFVNTAHIPTIDGDPPNTPFSRKRTAKAKYNREHNAIHVVEGGTILVKPAWKSPALEGKLMYDGMSVVLSASQDFGETCTIERDKEGRQVYTFRVPCAPGEDVVLAYAMGDAYAPTVGRVRKLLANPRVALEAKTKHMNDLLNRQIPYFRCSDTGIVRTYYYLWSLYFMYFTHTGKGWEQYPHTQTAVNNFTGLHLWDSWAYAAMGAWVADKWSYGHGNVLSWKLMVPFKSRQNALPDNFGVAWYSPGVWMNFVGTVELAWQQYEQSGDMRFLKEAYGELCRKLYWTGPQPCFGIEINALDALAKMAAVLGKDADVEHWRATRPTRVERFKRQWEAYLPHYYAPRGSRYKDIWHLACMLCREMPDAWADELVEHWVMNRDAGFLGPVPLEIRPPDSPENGVFAVSTMSTWLAVEGMFRHHRDAEAIFCTLGHMNGMLKDHGYPVAPECWDPHYKPWGSMYYNWCGAMTVLLLSRLAGIHYSIPDDTLTVCEHLPTNWDYIETRVPIVVRGRTRWATIRATRQERNGRVVKRVTVRGCPLKRLVIQPWLEDRKLLSTAPEYSASLPRGHVAFSFQDVENQSVAVVLGTKKRDFTRGDTRRE